MVTVTQQLLVEIIQGTSEALATWTLKLYAQARLLRLDVLLAEGQQSAHLLLGRAAELPRALGRYGHGQVSLGHLYVATALLLVQTHVLNYKKRCYVVMDTHVDVKVY